MNTLPHPTTLARLAAGQSLAQDEMSAVMDSIMQGGWSEDDIAALLLGLRAKGETVDEIAGAAAALRKHMTQIRSPHATLVDTCGTGGTGSTIFNVSTTAALVTAAAGVPVAKHGNRSVTSKSGSADVLAALGVNINAGVETVERCLAEVGICFCFAPLMHPSMKHVAAVRKRLGVQTIFNLLGPLCNPAGAPFQVLGVGKGSLRAPIAAALARLGTQRAVVVSGEEGLGEITIGGTTHVTHIQGQSLAEFDWRPRDFGLSAAPTTLLQVDGPTASAQIIRGVLAGEPGAARDIVLMNAAAALWVAGTSDEPAECARRAAQAIDDGAARGLLARLVEVSHS